MNCAGLVSAQPTAVANDPICEDVSDAQEMVRRLTDYNILREMDQVKDQRIANLEKENDLLKRENELKDRIIALKDMMIEAKDKAFADLKDVADRAIKLAEISKKSTLSEILEWIIRIALFAAGVFVGK